MLRVWTTTLWRLLGVMALLLSTPVWAERQLNMSPGVTEVSQNIYQLHMLIFYVCVVIAVAVFSVMFYSIYAHRKSKHPTPAQFHHSTKVEIIWTAIPVIILVLMALPAAKSLVRIEDTRAADMNILVTGYQWKWHYNYSSEGFGFFSNLDELSQAAYQLDSGIDPSTVPNYLREVDNPMVVPVNKKVRLLITAKDVIHGWWVPEFGGKMDAIPGVMREMWFQVQEPGIYRGQCTELCGPNHAFMPIVVHALPQADYDAWILEQTAGQRAAAEADAAALDRTWDLAELMQAGEKVYGTYCGACHQPDGKGMPPTFPSLVDGKMVYEDINAHIDIVIHGREGTIMAAFGDQLSDADIAAVVTYERNAWGINSGDVVQPTDVQSRR